ncbi:hypothetical protein LINPERHAP2_LOCUS638 [Linum perenne]
MDNSCAICAESLEWWLTVSVATGKFAPPASSASDSSAKIAVVAWEASVVSVCRDSLKRIDSEDLWIYTNSSEIVNLASILRDNSKRLFMYIDKLPLIVLDHLYSM